MRRASAAAMGAVMLLAGSGAAPSARRAQTFSTATNLVRIPAIVLDRAGQPVAGLRLEDFEVLENGRRQTVTFFTEGDDNEQLPLHLGLAFDKSSSMEAQLPEAAEAAVAFVNMVAGVHGVTLVEFDRTVRVERYRIDQYPELNARLRNDTLGPATMLYDAVRRYADDAGGIEGQHVLVVYTDGADSNSRTTLGELVNVLRHGNILVYAIGYLDRAPADVRMFSQSALLTLARETGGDAFFPNSARDLPAIYERIVRDIRGRYTLGYAPERVDGRFRRVQVRVTRPDLAKAVVRARAGYFAAPSVAAAGS